MKKIQIEKKNYFFLYFIGVVLIVCFISIGYSAFSNQLYIDNASVTVQMNNTIMVSDLVVNDSSNAISSYEEYTDDSISTRIEFQNNTGYIKYKVSITNLGNIEQGIITIDGLPSDLEYELLDYNLQEPICDSTNNCTLGATKDFFITIKYKDGITPSETNYNINLNFSFERFYNITYGGNACYNCMNKVIKTGTISANLPTDSQVSVIMNGLSINNDSFSYNADTGLFTLSNITGDVYINVTSYTRVLFIESTGISDQQYIDTLYTPNVNSEFVYDGMVVEGDTALFGTRKLRSGKNSFKYTLQYISANKYRVSFDDKDYEVSDTYPINSRYIFDLNNNSLKMNSSLVANPVLSSNYSTNYNMFLFSINTGGVASNFGKVRLYNFKILENGVLIKHFIPVLDLNNVPCLYETEEGRFYYNQGNGTFNYLTDSHLITNDIENMTFSNTNTSIYTGEEYRTIIIPNSGYNLPEALVITQDSIPLHDTDYSYNSTTGELIIYEVLGDIVLTGASSTILDSISTLGSQYVDTEYIPTINTKIVFTHFPLSSTYTSWLAFFGCRDGSVNTNSFYVSSGVGLLSAFVGNKHVSPSGNLPFEHLVGSKEVITLDVNKLSVTTYELNANNEYVENTNYYAEYINNSTTTINSPNSLYIFGRNEGNAFNYGAVVRFGSMQIYENGELVMDFVPFRDINGRLGLYEKKGYNNKFYYYSANSLDFAE